MDSSYNDRELDKTSKNEYIKITKIIFQISKRNSINIISVSEVILFFNLSF